jgi:hypothetical protein
MTVVPKALVSAYIAVWNLPDEERPGAMADVFTADVLYVDPLVATRGLAELSDYIGTTRRHFAGSRFVPRDPVNGHHDQILFGWECGPPDAESIVAGLDVALLDGERIKAIHGFFH